MSAPLVSIVIPFYNEERFLERAIDSALSQSYASTEIILINDGSTDQSQKIAKAYCDQHSHLTLVTTQNLGLSSARNIGINSSQGEFITFLDADDALESHAIQVLVSQILADQSDMVICKFTLYNKQQISFKQAGWSLDTSKINGPLAISKMYDGGIASVAWGKLYRAESFKKILFPIGLWFEDRPYVLECLLNTNKLSFVDESLLRIYSNESSITRRTVTNKRIIDLHLIYQKELQILDEYKKTSELSAHIINHHIDVLLDMYFLILIDHQQIKDSNSCQNTFIDYVLKFINHHSSYPNQINKKRKLKLFLLRSLSFLPWELVAILLKFIFRKKYTGVRLLKNS